MLNGEKIKTDVEKTLDKMDFSSTDDFLNDCFDIYDDESIDLKKRKKKLTNLLYRMVTIFGVKKLCSLFVSFMIDIVRDGTCNVKFKNKSYKCFIEDEKLKIEEDSGD